MSHTACTISLIAPNHNPDEGRTIINHNFGCLSDAISNLEIISATGSTSVTPGTNIGVSLMILSGAPDYTVSVIDNPVFSSLSATSISASTFFSGSTPLELIFSGANLWSASTGVNSIIANNGTGNVANGDFSIAGGYSNIVSGSYSFIGGGKQNIVSNLYASIVGGQQNITSGVYSAIVNGFSNSGTARYSTIVNGQNNNAYGAKSFIGNGRDNVVGGDKSFIGNGRNNSALASYSLVVGGRQNIASGTYSSILGGRQNRAISNYSVVVGGFQNLASGGWKTFVGGGQLNSATTSYASVVGGQSNIASGYNSFIGGGFNNKASGNHSTVFGYRNIASGIHSFAIGSGNTVSGQRSAVIGGQNINGSSNDTVYMPNVRLAETAGSKIFSAGTDLYNIFSTGGGISGNFLSISGGTVTGDTIFTTNVSANTLALTTTNTAAPLNFPVFISDPASPNNGDAWIVSAATGNALFNIRIGGITKTVELS